MFQQQSCICGDVPQEHFSKLKQEPPTSEETTQPLLKKNKNIYLLVELAQIGPQTHVFGPGSHFPSHGGRLCSNSFHLLLHLLPDTWDAHEGRRTRLLQSVYQRTL